MTNAPKKILLGVEFSPEADMATTQAMNLARHTGAELVLLHACTIPEPPAVLSEYEPPALHDYRARLDADLKADRDKLEEIRERLTGQGVEVSKIVVDAFPDTGICSAAKELEADLVVVGTHGRTGLKWLLLGSVAQRVVRLSESNVLVARGEGPTGGYQRLCVATDFSPTADRALEAALALTAHDAHVDVVHFWNLAPRLGFYEPIRVASLEEFRSSIDEEIRARGHKLIERHSRTGLTMAFHAVFEPPIPGLLQWLEKHNYDLAVLGSHGRRGFRRFVLGSVAEETARRAPCSVLVVHGGGDADAAAGATGD